MSGEAIIAVASKWGWSLIVPYLFWLHKKDKTKLDDIYTKGETKDLIDLKVSPVKQEFSSKTDTLHDKFDLILSMMKKDSDQVTERRKEADAQLKDNTKMLHSINTNVAVITEKVESLENRISDQ